MNCAGCTVEKSRAHSAVSVRLEAGFEVQESGDRKANKRVWSVMWCDLICKVWSIVFAAESGNCQSVKPQFFLGDHSSQQRTSYLQPKPQPPSHPAKSQAATNAQIQDLNPQFEITKKRVTCSCLKTCNRILKCDHVVASTFFPLACCIDMLR